MLLLARLRGGAEAVEDKVDAFPLPHLLLILLLTLLLMLTVLLLVLLLAEEELEEGE